MNTASELFSEIRLLTRNMRREAHNMFYNDRDYCHGEPRHVHGKGSGMHGHHGGHHGGRHGRGLSHGQFRYMRMLDENMGVSQKRMGEMLNIRPSSVTEITDTLEKDNMIRRERGRKDGRKRQLYMTAEGKQELEKMEQANNDFEQGFFSALTQDEQQQLLSLVKKINQHVEETQETQE